MSKGVLRAVTDDDLGQILRWRNHSEVRRFMYTTHEISLDEHRNWFERARANPDLSLMVYLQEGEPSGFVNISRTRCRQVADWGFYLAPEAVKGTGRQLGNCALEYAFGELGLHKVCGEALGFNKRSIRFHESLGFSVEGRLREQHYDGEGYHDVVRFGLLEHEWQAIRKGKEI